MGMRRIADSSAETRRYAATLRDGGRLDVTVFDRDQQAADLFYRLYRRLRLRTQVSRSAPLTVERAIERRALLTYATEDAGVPTPRLRALIRVGPEAAVLANESHDGTTLAELARPPTGRAARAGLGRRAPAAQPAGHAPGAHRRPDPADQRQPGPRRRRRRRPAYGLGPHAPGRRPPGHRRRRGHAARSGQRRRGGERPPAAAGPGPAPGRTGAAGRAGPGRRAAPARSSARTSWPRWRR